MKHRDAIVALIDAAVPDAPPDEVARLALARRIISGDSLHVLGDLITGRLTILPMPPGATIEMHAPGADPTIAAATPAQPDDDPPEVEVDVKPIAHPDRTPGAPACPECGTTGLWHAFDCPRHPSAAEAPRVTVRSARAPAEGETPRDRTSAALAAHASASPPTPTPARRGRGPRVTDAQWRDVIVGLGKSHPQGFTRADAQKRAGTSKEVAIKALGRFVDAGAILRTNGESPKSSRFRYVYIDPREEGGPTHRPRHDHPRATPGARAEVAGAALRAAGVDTSRAQPVPGTGSNGRVSSDHAVNELRRRVEAEGGRIDTKPGGHLIVSGPDGSCTIGSTPQTIGETTLANIRRRTGLTLR